MLRGLTWTEVACPVIGVIHLPALPGSPGFSGKRDDLLRQVLADASALDAGQVDAFMIENFGDAPFFPGRVPPEVVAGMTMLAAEIRHRFSRPLGINVLRNDAISAMAIAQAVGASFVRVNILGGARVTDQGLIQGEAHELLRMRARLLADQVEVLADLDVKHSAAIAERPVQEELLDLLQRDGADAIIVTGGATGAVADVRQLRDVREIANELQSAAIVGSGISPANVEQFLPWSDALIVGTAFKEDGQVRNLVDRKRVEQLMQRVQSYRESV